MFNWGANIDCNKIWRKKNKLPERVSHVTMLFTSYWLSCWFCPSTSMQGTLIATSPETFRRTVVSICIVDLASDNSTACVSSLFCDCFSRQYMCDAWPLRITTNLIKQLFNWINLNSPTVSSYESSSIFPRSFYSILSLWKIKKIYTPDISIMNSIHPLIWLCLHLESQKGNQLICH